MYTSNQLLEKVNQALDHLAYDRQPQGLYAPIKYELSLGGKRLRPVLMLLTYNMYKEDVENIMMQALGLEIYHNFTLLHDDVMDRADVRRGKPCVHKVWNDNTAILSGDTMIVDSFIRMQQCDPAHLPDVMDVFSRTALEISEGQQYDMEFESRNDVKEEEYLEMIRLKTSVLLACAVKIGALLGDATNEDAALLYDFGEKIGLAFQLQDDYLDVYGDFAVFGKRIGGDILCNKKTYLLIKAFEHANEGQRKELESWISRTEYAPQEKIDAVTRLYNEIGVRELCDQKINMFFQLAEQSLQKVSLPWEKKSQLWNYALQLMSRKS
ncbi:MAG: polyprenyl synthetase family protein [Bacteroidaceae bacterium]|nr:polyprenyl synthetase family protein [Bacteroidaceae bacterium]